MTQDESSAKPEIMRRPAMEVMGVLVKSTAEEQDFIYVLVPSAETGQWTTAELWRNEPCS